MSKRSKVGIVAWSTGDGSFGVTKAYLNYLEQMFDVDIILLCPTENIYEDLDLVIMPGGKDTSTLNYSRMPGYANSDPDQYKEAFMKVNLPMYIEAGVPIFGICLGFQQLVVHFGGELSQNINLGQHSYSDVEKKGRGDLVNTLVFTPEFKHLELKFLNKKPKEKNIKCCSLHHQGVEYHAEDPAYSATFPECLHPIAYTEDGVLEAFAHKELPIAGVQFHPEEDWNILGKYLIQSLLSKSLITSHGNIETSRESKR